METLLLDILAELKKNGVLDDKGLARIIHRHNKMLNRDEKHYSKKRLLPFYLKVKEAQPERWASWNISEEAEKQLLRTLQVKPRRTASGVATITVITKPWKCSSNCLYCPNDLRMPKSYLSDEPACQRAERNYFDPYLQVASRLRALTHMGHRTDKIELIVLGGTWSDYSKDYQTWFITELFRALNDGDSIEDYAKQRREFYKQKGLSNQEEGLKAFVAEAQAKIDAHELSYNQAMDELYRESDAWKNVSSEQKSSIDELNAQQSINEHALHRVVGLVVETRPDTINPSNLELLRRLGCTKIQMGIQSLNEQILQDNKRNITASKIRESFELLRLFGFKIHAHFMVNLYGSSPQEDIADYQRFVNEAAYQPDEVKLYPCVLVKGTKLCELHEQGKWRPYTEEELIEVLSADTLETPAFTRISRMIRDISAHDIIAGNKKTNLRQLVENSIEESGAHIAEIRHREISTHETDIADLKLVVLPYETTVTQEYFLQWVNAKNQIAGFLRLSLPENDFVQKNLSTLPIKPDEAMIREVHVYGKVAGLKGAGENAQHLGLGKQLIEEACTIARANGYRKMNVISSVGTREYYRKLGFQDNTLYQQKPL